MTDIVDRFADRDDLIEALRGQKIVANDISVAAALADSGKLVSFAPGEEIVRQGASDNDCYFVLAGSVDMKINGEILPYGRGANDVVGEFSAINPQMTRSATLIAREEMAALQCSAKQLKEALRDKAEVWRLLAIELTKKVEQRNQLIAATNERPRIFMIAAENRIAIAEQLKLALSKDFDIDLWSDEDLVPPGDYQLEVLHKTAKNADFGIVLAHPQDLAGRGRVSDEEWETVLFELGFLMSELTHLRTLVMIPDGGKGAPPQLFKGVQPMTYQLPDGDMPPRVALAKAVEAIRGLIGSRKLRSRLKQSA